MSAYTLYANNNFVCIQLGLYVLVTAIIMDPQNVRESKQIEIIISTFEFLGLQKKTI